MCLNSTPEHVLEDIIYARRSIREMTDEIPDTALIRMVINAGYAAPHAASAQGFTPDYRRFIVIPRSSPLMSDMAVLGKKTILQMINFLEKSKGKKENNPAFIGRMRSFIASEIPGIGTAPYLVIIAEKKGFPPIEQQSIAHCLENMWLMATALGLGFHLVSVISELGNIPDFCNLVGIPVGEYGLNGCAIGIPAHIPPAEEKPDAESVTTWIS